MAVDFLQAGENRHVPRPDTSRSDFRPVPLMSSCVLLPEAAFDIGGHDAAALHAGEQLRLRAAELARLQWRSS